MSEEKEPTHLITSCTLTGLRKIFTDVDRGATLERYKQISNIAVNENFDVIFAEPVFTKNSDKVNWFTSIDGDIYKFSELNDQQIKEVKHQIWSTCKKLDDLTTLWSEEGKKNLANIMEGSIEIPSLDSVFLVNNKVVLCNWGFVEDRFNAQKGIIRKIAQEFSNVTVNILILTESSKPLSGVSVEIENVFHDTDASGSLTISNLELGSSIDLNIKHESYEIYSEKIKINSNSLKKEITLLKKTPTPSTYNENKLILLNSKGSPILEKSVKIINDINAHNEKSDKNGVIDLKNYKNNEILKINPGICYTATPKSIKIQNNKPEHEVVIKNRCLLLLLIPLLFLALLGSWFFIKNSFSPMLAIHIEGKGEVISPNDICSYKQSCNAFYTGFGEVTIIAKPAEGYIFKGWKDICNGSSPSCTLNLSANERAIAIFEPNLYSLKVDVDNNQGTVYSSIPILNAFKCGKAGNDCEEKYSFGEMVDLDAQEYTNFTFDYWKGDCTNPRSRRCKILIDSNKNVQAIFKEADSILSVDILGEGYVKVETNKSAEVICDSKKSPCLYTKFKSGWKAHITPEERKGFEFVRWEGACSGSNNLCKLYLSSSKKKSVIAIFEKSDIPLKVEVATGQGKIISNDNNIKCPENSCSYKYTYGSIVELKALPDNSLSSNSNKKFIFDHWSGACNGSGKCVVLLNDAKKVKAHFRELISCSDKKVAREENGPADYAKWMEVGLGGGEINYIFEPYDIYDRLIMKYENHVILDTQCVGGGRLFSGNIEIPKGKDSRIFVEVRGGCRDNQERKTTGWDLVVQCPTKE